MSDQSFNEAEEASSLLQMARQLHEQHVSSARAEAERVLSTAHSEANRLVTEASATANALVTDATTESENIRRNAHAELAELQQTISEAREFEGAYRESLRKYLTNLLKEVRVEDETPIVEEAAAPADNAPSFVNPGFTVPAAVAVAETPAFDTEATFDDDALDADVFDRLAEPDASAEDVAFGEPAQEETFDEFYPTEEAPVEETVSFPSFNEPYAEVTPAVDTVQDLVEAEAQVSAATDAIPTVDVIPTAGDAVDDDNIDSLLESLADLNGTEVDNDGGSTVDSIEDDEEVTVPAPQEEIVHTDFNQVFDTVEATAEEAPDDAYQGHVEPEAATEAYEIPVEETPTEASDEDEVEHEESAFEPKPAVESFDSIISSAPAEEGKATSEEEKPKFSFFNKK